MIEFIVCIVFLLCMFAFALYKAIKTEKDKILETNIMQYLKNTCIKSVIFASVFSIAITYNSDLGVGRLIVSIILKMIIFVACTLIFYGFTYLIVKKCIIRKKNNKEKNCVL